MKLRGTDFCRLCSGQLGETILSLGSQPLSNGLPMNGGELESDEFPLDFRICPSCSMGQIGEYVSPQGIFKDYTYFSSTSLSWLKHAEGFASSAFTQLQLTSQDLVLEIASNDGYLLQYFQLLGTKVLGIEPAENVAQQAILSGIPTRVEFFGTESAQKLLESKIVPKLVVCNNVLAHVPDIDDFMSGLAKLIRAGAIVSIEAPSLKIMLQNGLFDTIYHEHFSYLSVTAVDRLARKHEVALQHVELLSTHGGSYRFWIKSGNEQREKSVEIHLEEERLFGITDLAVHSRFAKNSKKAILNFRQWCLGQDLLPIGFGAAAKATVMLNAAKVTRQHFECIADNALAKQNRIVPGVKIPIYSPSQVLSMVDRNLIIFPWNIADEIASEITLEFPEFMGQIWTALPEMRRLR